jgi:L-2,4-diaminobutyrate decarboxylase
MTDPLTTPRGDRAFQSDAEGLEAGLDWLLGRGKDAASGVADLPLTLPQAGLGEEEALRLLAPLVLGEAAALDASMAFAHMDPPTPWISWVVAQWNARLNQNLLHPATAPAARAIEARLFEWLCPAYGMEGGLMTGGSTLGNLTALWAARDGHGARRVLAGEGAHLSIAKAARILGMAFETLPSRADGAIDPGLLPSLCACDCLVLTCGTTGTGAIDPMGLRGGAGYVHVDAAWAGPFRLSNAGASLLDGIEAADSVAISGHKLFYQPKDSGLVMFRDWSRARAAISMGGAYLAAPNVGLAGSRGASATVLAATLAALGRDGLAERLDAAIAQSRRFGEAVEREPKLERFAPPVSAIVNWRPRHEAPQALLARLPEGFASTTMIKGETWIRSVFANPNLDLDLALETLKKAL